MKKRELVKLMRDNDFILIREKKHYVFAHVKTNRKVVVSSTTKDKCLMHHLKRDMKYASRDYCEQVH